MIAINFSSHSPASPTLPHCNYSTLTSSWNGALPGVPLRYRNVPTASTWILIGKHIFYSGLVSIRLVSLVLQALVHHTCHTIFFAWCEVSLSLSLSLLLKAAIEPSSRARCFRQQCLNATVLLNSPSIAALKGCSERFWRQLLKGQQWGNKTQLFSTSTTCYRVYNTKGTCNNNNKKHFFPSNKTSSKIVIVTISFNWAYGKGEWSSVWALVES